MRCVVGRLAELMPTVTPMIRRLTKRCSRRGPAARAADRSR